MVAWRHANVAPTADLVEVHAFAQAHFEYVPDPVRRGQIDYWMSRDELQADLDDLQRGGKVRGDCDDFALLCRLLLRQRGVPNRLAYCQVETGEAHLVCEVDGWILDNRQGHVEPRQNLEAMGYKFLMLSGYAKDEDWHEVVV